MFGFANSGAEAVEAAVKLARKTSGRQAVIAFRGGFHGRTMGSVSYTTSNAKYRDGYHPVLGSVFVSPFPHPYRWGLDEQQATDLALDELQRMFRHEISPGHVACFLIEPVQGEGGYYPAPVRFLQELRRIADEQGILLVFDEVQTGFRRVPAAGRPPTTTASPPTSSPWARGSPTGCPFPPMARRASGWRRGRWARTEPPSAATRWLVPPPLP